MARQLEHDHRDSDYVVALTRLFTEALNARDYEAMRALVAEDAELRGPHGSALRGYPAASELLEAVAHFDLVVARTALETPSIGRARFRSVLAAALRGLDHLRLIRSVLEGSGVRAAG